MRILRIFSGFSVLTTTLAYAALIHRYATMTVNQNPVFWVGLAFSILVGVLSLIGAFFLLGSRGARP